MNHQVLVVATVMTIMLPWLPSSVHSFPTFRESIPNGKNIMSPCVALPFVRILGAGHESPFGGGALNVFGEAFKAAGYQWTTELCQADSDGDRMTNGEELGDPDCEWSPDSEPSRTTSITHPGINNESPQCIQRFIEFIIQISSSRRPEKSLLSTMIKKQQQQ